MTNQPPPIPPKRKQDPSPAHISQQQHLGNREDPIHPVVLVSALLAIAIIVLIIAWFLISSVRSLPDTAANTSQDASTAVDEIKLGTGAEKTSNEPTDVDLEEDHEDNAGQTDSQPAAKQNEDGKEVDDKSNQPPLEDTANESITDGDTKTNRTRLLNTGSSKRLSADGTNPFFIGTETNSTVFVIDKSSSMSGPAFLSVRDSLLQAIETLNSSQRFSVIFFDDGPHPMPPKHMVVADDKGKNTASKFIKKMSPSGGTNPYSATIMALDMNPESIVVLSDGEFDITEVVRITRENQTNGKIPIHCIGLQAYIATLRQLAENNSGTYRTAVASP